MYNSETVSSSSALKRIFIPESVLKAIRHSSWVAVKSLKLSSSQEISFRRKSWCQAGKVAAEPTSLEK